MSIAPQTGHLQPADPQVAQALSVLGAARQRTQIAAARWESASAATTALSIATGMLGTMIGMAGGMDPTRVMVGTLGAAGAAASLAMGSVLRAKWLRVREQALAHREHHYGNGGNEQSFKGQLLAEGHNLAQRMLSQRAAQQANRQAQKQNAKKVAGSST